MATKKLVQEEKVKELEISAVHVLNEVCYFSWRKGRRVKVHPEETASRLWLVRTVERPKSLKSITKNKLGLWNYLHQRLEIT